MFINYGRRYGRACSKYDIPFPFSIWNIYHIDVKSFLALLFKMTFFSIMLHDSILCIVVSNWCTMQCTYVLSLLF